MKKLKLKNLYILAIALAFTACQPSAPTASNVQKTQPSPTVSATNAPVVSNSGNANISNAPTANVKSNQQIISPSPTVSPTPKPIASSTASAASKFKNYTANGVVKAIDAGKNLIVIDHEDIGDYMVAMEMPFPVVNKDLLKNIKTGDKVEFVLETGVGVERIIKIRKK